MPLTRPDAAELIEAVRGFLRDVAAPALSHQPAFHARVAANALDIALREWRLGPALEAAEGERLAALLERQGSAKELTTALAEALREGELALETPGLLEHLALTARDKVRLANPRYLLAEDTDER